VCEDDVINEMKHGKAPSLDGFDVDFFKACTEKVKQGILDVVEDPRRTRSFLKDLNASFRALITNKKNI